MDAILVTGGAGFIGVNLCLRLLGEGHKVVCVDNLFSSSINNIKHLINHSNFIFFQEDILNFNKNIVVDGIYNLACPASPKQYQKDPIYTLKTNIYGANNVLQLAQRLNIPILQASTSEVYGDPLEHPQVEEYKGNVNCIGVRSCYDEGKRAAETLCMDYRRMYGTNTKIVRIFNTYGPFMSEDDGRVVSNFIVKALKNEPLEIYGDGKQTRSFCYVDDLVEGLIRAANQEFDSGPINLGNDQEYTMLELANKIINITNSRSNIEFKPLPQDDPKKRKPCIQKAKQLLGWKPKVGLNDGLQKTIEYFKNL
ncbi:UDP-glucuronic acid decarboxylase family protein [Petroclostridium sp. X23]|uniref:UDP-glucuronic acid decarboxylase family protein n=1 Tax=Petroclostridium sp. X23 TaxID=3045146 RepID=UPI0024ADA218|nr:UDP-glucuronic acid decarboxylase family protein [Petroclostridium sp. X23]WHH58350.1 SDR family oxidoreductase [Petroclostridium sp. X23]